MVGVKCLPLSQVKKQRNLQSRKKISCHFCSKPKLTKSITISKNAVLVIYNVGLVSVNNQL